MTKEIWKYTLRPGTNQLEVPEGAQTLHVDKQRSDTEIFVWMLIDPNAPRVEWKKFHVIGTGHQFDDERVGKYVGTLLLMGDSIVVHVFEGL